MLDNIIVIVAEEWERGAERRAIIAYTMVSWKFVCLHSLLILSKINNFIIAPTLYLLSTVGPVQQ